MKKFFFVVAVSMAGLFAILAARAGESPLDRDGITLADAAHGMPVMPGKNHAAGGARDRGSFAFGRPGDAKKVDRTIRIEALDTMRYDQHKLAVRAGETVRFVVTNTGRIRHEFVIGDAAKQHEHEMEMRVMPGMPMHDDANGIGLAPGETKSIVWQFAKPGTVEFACHEPGHFQAGMIGRIAVAN
ncbi:MAG: cupredoxin domain-containing protein [Sulfuricaulis sp.]